ncbi:MAG: GNAT family N-acetyltransferase [Epsilonproteobacteria bacterium]|nr:GNAT family N-acetyltransferase [Campylobacterota bacterium]
MQIREIGLKELDLVYSVLSKSYQELTYKEFEDLIYDMREINYKMLGIFDNEELISYAGVVILTTFKDKRHLKVFDFITSDKYDVAKYDKLMKEYINDYAKMAMCESVKF